MKEIDMLQDFKCINCTHYKNLRGMHWCAKCQDEIKFETKNLLGKGYLFVPKACYFNNYFQPKEINIPSDGLCNQVED